MASAGNSTSTSWSKYKRGSAVGTAMTINNTSTIVTSPTVIVIEEFDADVFRQLVEYVHTGCVILQPRTLLGKYTSHYQNDKMYFINVGDEAYLGIQTFN